jgi:hypothetical protein
MNKEIEKIIVKFLTNSANEEDLNKLTDWLKTKDNIQFFDHYIETNYALDMNMNEFDSNGVKKALAKKIRQDRSVFYKYKVFKYAAAAVIVFGLGYFFRDNFFNKTLETMPIIVNTNTIVPGTDKATLTLEDGSVIALEKGASFKTQNANSNGEEIVYESGKRNSKKVVYNYLTIPRGGEFFIKLSDGTQVWLNSESQLKYPVSFVEGEPRQVELVYGEAYFDVSPSIENQGSKFKVVNNAQDVEVLGTEFNIKAYKDEVNIYTTLVEGKVIVSALNKTKTLIPNEQLNLNRSNNSIIVLSGVDVFREISWKEGVFSFRDKSLKDIMKVLSRWYDIKVVFNNKDIEKQTFHGSLDKKLSIEKILSIISTTNNIWYEINDNTVLLK